MRTRTLGTDGPTVSEIGLGCMGMSEFYGRVDADDARRTLDAALAAGVSLWDSADFYGSGHNEMLIGAALRGRRDEVVLSIKFGLMRDPNGGYVGQDGRPAAVKNFLAQSLRRLGTDHVDIYRLSRTDPAVPIDETVGAIAEMVDAGFVRHIGLSEASASDIRAAAAVHPICDLQTEYSIVARAAEHDVLPTCRELGIGVTVYGVLSMGLLSNNAWSPQPSPPTADDAAASDLRGVSPRFAGTNLERNQRLVAQLDRLAVARGATIAQVAIAWVLAQGDDIVPLIGARTPARLAESLGAVDLVLDAGEIADLAEAIPEDAVAGTLYPTG